MEELELADWETDRRREFNTHTEIRIENFRTATVPKRELERMKNGKFYPDLTVKSLISVFPDGFNKKTKGWVVILTEVSPHINGTWYRNHPGFSCTVSVIDIEGKCRFPRSFERDCGLLKKMRSLNTPEYSHEKYLEKSFIINRADEILPEDVLTLRFDFCFDYNIVGFLFPDMMTRVYSDFLFSVTNSNCLKDEDETGDLSDISTIYPRYISSLYDFTSQVLTLPQFHESRKRFGVYGIPPSPSSLSSDSKKDRSDILEHVWMFDTRRDRFLLSLDERQDSVGARLLNASPIIRKCKNTPMKEQQFKRMEFTEVASETFINVLFFLEKGMLGHEVLSELVDVYKFSHIYEMEALRRKCAEEMIKKPEHPTEFEEVKNIADIYSDEYLSELLDSRWYEFENFEKPQLKIEHRPDSDCYI